ncbi:TonB-dependent receptor [Pedobacter immunditicola]|uniref:TonB-dependent receptor n=1 Tax=Pedobacter immunditicola TaxID=3133440 RepID=UPI00309F6F43
MNPTYSLSLTLKTLMLFLFMSWFGMDANGQTGTIRGQVLDEDEALSAISLQINGTNYATKTNDQGYYEFADIPAQRYTLVISGVGYQKLEKIALLKENQVLVVNAKLSKHHSNLDEVVVTGMSRSTVLRKSPVPIAVLSKRAMDQQVSSNLIDAIVKGIPGVSAVTTGPNISKPFIRGLGYNRVLTLFDGLRQEGQQWGDEHGIEIDPYGISRVEVVKGPASLTYGSDAVAGVINMIPDQSPLPEGMLKGDFTTEYQHNNGMFGNSLGLALHKNGWRYAARASGKIAHSYRNQVDGLVYGTAFQEYNLSASAAVHKKWGHSKIAANYYNNLQEIPDGSRDSLSRKFTRQVLDEGDDIKNRPVVPENELNSYRIVPLHQHIQHYRIYNSGQYKLGNSLLDVLVGGQQSVRREYNHPTTPGQAGLYLVLNTLNFDAKYHFPEFNGIQSTLGLSGMYQTNRNKDATDYPIPNYDLFDMGAFFFAKKSFGKLDLSAGVRVDDRKVDWNDFAQFTAFDKRYQGVSGSAGITYNLTERILFKANIARGYRAPNITEIGSNGLDPGAHIVYLGNRTFVPEFNLQQDIGFMAYLKNIDLSLELFNNNIQNYIYQARLTDENGEPVVVVPGNLTYQYKQSAARLYGLEASVNIHPTAVPWFTLNNSVSYVVGKTNGQHLPLLPPLQLRSEMKFAAQTNKTSIFSKPYIKFEANYHADKNRFYALDDTETFTDGYALFSAGLGTGLKNKQQKTFLEVFIQGENLFDTAYQSHLNRLKYFEYFQSSPNGRSGIYNMGRNFSVKVIVPIGL